MVSLPQASEQDSHGILAKPAHRQSGHDENVATPPGDGHMPDVTLEDLRQRSAGMDAVAGMIGAIRQIRVAGRLPDGVTDEVILGYSNLVVDQDEAARNAWVNRATDPQPWVREVGRLGAELADLVATMRKKDGGRPVSEGGMAAAAASDRQWQDYVDQRRREAAAAQKAPKAKPPTGYFNLADVVDGLTVLAKLPNWAPRIFTEAFVSGVTSSDPVVHAAWQADDHAEFHAQLPRLARELARQVDAVANGPQEPPLRIADTPRQLERLSERDWQRYQQDYADAAAADARRQKG
jgi:hypothetical protein